MRTPPPLGMSMLTDSMGLFFKAFSKQEELFSRDGFPKSRNMFWASPDTHCLKVDVHKDASRPCTWVTQGSVPKKGQIIHILWIRGGGGPQMWISNEGVLACG